MFPLFSKQGVNIKGLAKGYKSNLSKKRQTWKGKKSGSSLLGSVLFSLRRRRCATVNARVIKELKTDELERTNNYRCNKASTHSQGFETPSVATITVILNNVQVR